MKNTSKKYLISVIFFCLIILVNLFLFYQLFLHNPEVKIAAINYTAEDGKYHYDIKFHSNLDSPEEVLIQLFFTEGQRQEYKWPANEGAKILDFVSASTLEYVNLQLPDGMEDTDKGNNSQVINMWSPSLKITGLNVNADYQYLVDRDGNLWFLFCDRQEGDPKPQIYLNVISPRGDKVVNNHRLSIPGEYSVEPDILRDEDGLVRIAWSSYRKGQDVIYYLEARLDGSSLSEETRFLHSLPNTAMTRPQLYHFASGNYLLVNQETREPGQYLSEKYFTVYEIGEEGFQQASSLFAGKEKQNVAFMPQGQFFYKKLFQDKQGNLYLIWGDQTHRYKNLYFTKISPEGELLVNNKKIKMILIGGSANLNITLYDGRFHMAWNEWNNIIQRYNELNHMAIDTEGEVILEEHRLTEPTPMLLSGINMEIGSDGLINLAWVDERAGTPTNNMDIIYSKINTRGDIVVPPYRLTTDRTDEMGPQLYLQNGTRYALWQEYSDEENYQALFKNTDPELKEILEQENRWVNILERAGSLIVAAFISVASLLIFFVPFNILPIIGLIGYFKWLTDFYQYNNVVVWLGVFLGLFPLKVLNEYIINSNFVNLMKIGLKEMYRANLISLVLIIILYFLLRYLGEKLKISSFKMANIDFQTLFIGVWLLIDTIAVLTYNLLYYLQ
ncbi:MAG: hypothetical protein UMV23_00520 [Halanaerobium sp.]|nr:hypothetical protein [Halanaerobium sp.]